MKKKEIEYEEPTVQNPMEIEKEGKKEKYFDTALEFFKVDLDEAKEKDEKKLDVLESVADFKPNNTKIEEKPNLFED